MISCGCCCSVADCLVTMLPKAAFFVSGLGTGTTYFAGEYPKTSVIEGW